MFRAGCAKGGRDHVTIWPDGNARFPKPHLWCRWCDAYRNLDGSDDKPIENKPPPSGEPTLNPKLVLLYHNNITPQAYEYFENRGISGDVADYYKLGWKEVGYNERGKPYYVRRYAIPGFAVTDEGWTLYGIQLRASRPDDEKRYISETGSVNSILFNQQILREIQGMYVLVIESPLDALALRSYGYPAVSPFAGNAVGGWKREWTNLLKGIPERVIVPDNDNNRGDVLAADKLNEIPRSRILRLPDQFKDTGKLIESDLSSARQRLQDWLRMPPILGEL